MESVRGLYESAGFRPIAPYYSNPIGGGVYMGLSVSCRRISGQKTEGPS